jgi:hypothetical protein
MHKDANGQLPQVQEIRPPDEIFDTLDLRLSLIRAYKDLNADRITPSKARAISQMARAITDTVRLEVQAARDHISGAKPIMLMPKPVDQRAIEDKP